MCDEMVKLATWKPGEREGPAAPMGPMVEAGLRAPIERAGEAAAKARERMQEILNELVAYEVHEMPPAPKAYASAMASRVLSRIPSESFDFVRDKSLGHISRDLDARNASEVYAQEGIITRTQINEMVRDRITTAVNAGRLVNALTILATCVGMSRKEAQPLDATFAPYSAEIPNLLENIARGGSNIIKGNDNDRLFYVANAAHLLDIRRDAFSEEFIDKFVKPHIASICGSALRFDLGAYAATWFGLNAKERKEIENKALELARERSAAESIGRTIEEVANIPLSEKARQIRIKIGQEFEAPEAQEVKGPTILERAKAKAGTLGKENQKKIKRTAAMKAIEKELEELKPK